MGWRPDHAVRLEALAVAMRAISGALDAEDVADLVTKAEQLLGSAHPIARAVLGFATQHDLHRFDGDKVAELGRALRHRLDVLAMPEPPDMNRRDIHG